MSYQKRKLKKNKFSQLKYRFGLVKIALLKFIKKVARKEKKMRSPQTRNIMQWLRKRNKIIRPNNLRVNEWVDDYINRCIFSGKQVEILTQWCISKDLEVRYQRQGNTFIPTKKERVCFEKEIPRIAEVFSKNGAGFNWWATFNRSYLNSGRIDPNIEVLYIKMVAQLAEPLIKNGWLIFADWENDILGKRSEPNMEVLASIESFVNPAALKIEIQRHSSWAQEEAGLRQSEEELKLDVHLQIAYEVEEGRLLNGGSIFEEFIIIPLEVPERYDFFTLRAPDFKKRIVAVLPSYPWRLKETC